MNNEKRDFKGIWIPKDVWMDKNLSALDKVILMEIDSLDISDNGCFASNEYLADFCLCSARKVSDSINKLIKLGYVSAVSFDGRQRHLRSRLAKSARQTSKNCEAESQILLHNNIDNKSENKIDNKDIVELPRQRIPYYEIVDLLNKAVNAQYRATNRKTREKIQARFNEGFTFEDFVTVIQKKTTEWKGTDMEKYLRPETLFGTKFEGYLNQKVDITTKEIARDMDFSDFDDGTL